MNLVGNRAFFINSKQIKSEEIGATSSKDYGTLGERRDLGFCIFFGPNRICLYFLYTLYKKLFNHAKNVYIITLYVLGIRAKATENMKLKDIIRDFVSLKSSRRIFNFIYSFLFFSLRVSGSVCGLSRTVHKSKFIMLFCFENFQLYIKWCIYYYYFLIFFFYLW